MFRSQKNFDAFVDSSFAGIDEKSYSERYHIVTKQQMLQVILGIGFSNGTTFTPIAQPIPGVATVRTDNIEGNPTDFWLAARDFSKSKTDFKFAQTNPKGIQFPNHYHPDQQRIAINPDLLLLRVRSASYLAGAFLIIDATAQYSLDQKLKLKQDLSNIYRFYNQKLQTRIDQSSPISNWKSAESEFQDFLYYLSKTTSPNNNVDKAWKHLQRAERLVRQEMPGVSFEATYDVKFSAQDTKTFRHRINPQYSITEDQKAEWLKVLAVNKKDRPKWYQKLAPWEQSYWQQKVNYANATGDWQFFKRVTSAIQRQTPGLANYHSHEFYEMKGTQEQLISAHLGFSAPSPIDNYANQEEYDQVTLLNLQQMSADRGVAIVLADAQHPGQVTRDDAQVDNFLQRLRGTNPKLLSAIQQFNNVLKPVNPKHRLVLIRPLSTAGYLTPARYDFSLLMKEDNNYQMWRSKTDSIVKLNKQLTINQGGYVTDQGFDDKSLGVIDHIYDPNFAINGRRGWVHPAAEKHTKQVKLDFIRDQLLNLVNIARLNSFETNAAHHDDKQFTDILDKIFVAYANKDLTALSNILNDHAALLQTYINPQKHQALDLLRNAVNDFAQLSQPQPSNKRNKELFLASLFSIIHDQMDILTNDHCKSTKDRHELVDAHKNAMYLFYRQQGRLPNYTDNLNDRYLFVQCFAAVVRPAVQTIYSGFLNPGSNGTKDEHSGNYSWLVGSLHATSMIPFDMRDAIAYEQMKAASKLNKPKIPLVKFPTWQKVATVLAIAAMLAVMFVPGAQLAIPAGALIALFIVAGATFLNGAVRLLQRVLQDITISLTYDTMLKAQAQVDSVPLAEVQATAAMIQADAPSTTYSLPAIHDELDETSSAQLLSGREHFHTPAEHKDGMPGSTGYMAEVLAVDLTKPATIAQTKSTPLSQQPAVPPSDTAPVVDLITENNQAPLLAPGDITAHV